MLGVQQPRIRLAPFAADSTAWRDAVDLAGGYGLVADEWQQDVLEGALGETHGRWAAPRVGLACPRQNGKNVVLEIRELAGLLIFHEKVILHSAHELKTSLEAFRRIRSLFENWDDLRKRVKAVRLASGMEAIEMLDGGILRFIARSKGSGRGFTADLIVLDEAQELSDDTFAAILPTTSARRNRQIWLAGTPPAPKNSGEVFTRFRNSGIEGRDSRLFWAEWSCEPGVDLDDVTQWARANPGYGYRITHEAIADERAAMDDETFARERLGMWAGVAGLSVIDGQTWAEIADTESKARDRFALAIDVSPDRALASVAFAGQRADGLWHVELDEQRAGVGWVPGYVASLIAANPSIRALVVDGASPAASMLDELSRSIRVTVTTARDMAAACGQFYDGVVEGWLRHTGQPQLAVAVSVARKRSIGDAWAWNRKNAHADITPLVSTTLALWGAQTTTARKPARKTERRVITL